MPPHHRRSGETWLKDWVLDLLALSGTLTLTGALIALLFRFL